MPPLQGEERLLTVFADIHYYFTAPTPKPLHHRFDKGSYFYIYHNANRQTSRLEVANHPGSPEQDAFNGSLDTVRLTYSYKFPTLLTLTVDALDPAASGASASSLPHGRDSEQWRLPSADPRDQGKYMFRLHTLDLYFWMLEDARLVIDTAKRLLRSSQLDIMDAPQTEGRHQDDVSPVVENLEHVAISDPAYANGQTRNSQNQSSQSPRAHISSSQTQSPAPPSDNPHKGHQSPAKAEDTKTSFAPMAYNPAAPAAPEPRTHREKTPPPADADEGTGLAAAAKSDHAPPYGFSQSLPYGGIPTSSPPNYGPHGPSPSQPPGRMPSTASNAHATSSSYAAPPSGAVSAPGRQPATSMPSYAPPPTDPNAQFYGSGSSTPMQSPSAQIYGSPPYGPQHHHPLQHVQPQYADYLSAKAPPPGGYAQYSYEQPNQPPTSSSEYDIHNQVYRPTELEANKPHSSRRKSGSTSQRPGKVVEGADRVEKGVNRFLKKLEKRVG